MSKGGVIEAVRSPLGFFVLVVLVAEVLLGAIALDGPSSASSAIVWSMIGIIGLLVGVVAYLAVRHPEALFASDGPKGNVAASVVYPPTQRDRYANLFDGFDDDEFIAFNPPFEVERAGALLYRNAIAIHSRRWKRGVHSQYLFYSPDAMERAGLLFDEVVKETGIPCKEAVDVRLAAMAEAPGFTFFLGRKRKQPVIVLYPRAVMEDGVPKAVIHIAGAEDLYQILHRYFRKQWKIADQVPHRSLQAAASGAV